MSAPVSATSLAAVALMLFSIAITGTAAEPGSEGPATLQTVATSSSPLDGKIFVTQSGEKGKQASNKDTFVFRNGRFLSEGCNPWGFGDAPYRATVDGDAIRFHAETHSPTHGNMVWDGIIRGDTVEATNVWTRERWYWNIKREYWYKGELKK